MESKARETRNVCGTWKARHASEETLSMLRKCLDLNLGSSRTIVVQELLADTLGIDAIRFWKKVID